MKILRTPDHRFDQLEDYPFAPHYLEVGTSNIRMHYVAEGPSDGQVVLLLHGEPSWSYLYRKMIPLFAAQGYRTIAPDLVGFGKSDKPSAQSDYSYQSHLDWLSDFIRQLDLQKIILFCQDWGGLLGLRLLTEQTARFDKVVVANTTLPTGNIEMPKAFTDWVHFAQNSPDFIISSVINMGTVSSLSAEVLRGYDAPFPDESYKAGSRAFPGLVPTTVYKPEAGKNQAAWKIMAQLPIPMLTLFSDSDPIMRGGEKVFQKIVPGTQGQPHEIIQQAGHFLQEDKGAEIAQKVIDWLRNMA